MFALTKGKCIAMNEKEFEKRTFSIECTSEVCEFCQRLIARVCVQDEGYLAQELLFDSKQKRGWQSEKYVKLHEPGYSPCHQVLYLSSRSGPATGLLHANKED